MRLYKMKILSGQMNLTHSREDLERLYHTRNSIDVYRRWLNGIEKAFEDGIKDGSIDYGRKLEDLIVNQNDLKKMVKGFVTDIDSDKSISMTIDFTTSFEKLQISEGLSINRVSEVGKGMHDPPQDTMAGE